MMALGKVRMWISAGGAVNRISSETTYVKLPDRENILTHTTTSDDPQVVPDDTDLLVPEPFLLPDRLVPLHVIHQVPLLVVTLLLLHVARGGTPPSPRSVQGRPLGHPSLERVELFLGLGHIDVVLVQTFMVVPGVSVVA
jgi:hypothetical protein